MDLKNKILEIKSHLNDTDDLSQLSQWDNELSVEFSWIAATLGEVKKDRALKELEIKKRLITDEGKYTEKAIEREYFASEPGQFYALATEQLKAIGKLISAIRFKEKMLKEPLS